LPHPAQIFLERISKDIVFLEEPNDCAPIGQTEWANLYHESITHLLRFGEQCRVMPGRRFETPNRPSIIDVRFA
jgi:hypothetical protein